jgi:hypothetical protein
MLEVHLNDIPVQMELDTGAAVSIITNATYKRIQRESFVSALQPAESKLRAYTGHHIQVLGLTRVKVRYDKVDLCLSVHVVAPTFWVETGLLTSTLFMQWHPLNPYRPS